MLFLNVKLNCRALRLTGGPQLCCERKDFAARQQIGFVIVEPIVRSEIARAHPAGSE